MKGITLTYVSLVALMLAGNATAQEEIAPGATLPGEGTHLPIEFIVTQVGNTQFTKITFEGGFSGGGVHAIQPTAGATFSANSLILIDSDAGGTGNFANEPSPSTIAFWLSGGSISVTFDDPVSDVGLFYTSSVPVSLQVFDVNGNLLSTINGGAQHNVGCTGDPFGSFCNWTPLSIDLGQNVIRSATFSGVANQTGFEDFTFSRISSCTVDVQRLSQGDPQWANNLYDNSTRTIRELGCALTALSMGLNFGGIENDPASLNEFMIQTDSDYVGTAVNWGPATRDRSDGALKFNARRVNSRDDLETASQFLEDTLCQRGFPVIVGVNLDMQGTPQHFVLVTGVQDGQFLIADPGFANNTTLDAYNNEFETRGLVADPPGDISELDISVGDNAELLVTDLIGNRTGFDPSIGERVEEIPQSVHFRDALENDLTGEPPLDTAHSVQIFQPLEATHHVIVTGLKPGVYTLTFRAFSQDGSAQPELLVPGIAGVGSTASFEVEFESSPGATSTVVRVASFESTLQDIQNSFELGLITNEGIAEALLSQIEAAAAAANRGQIQTTKNILRAFKALVQAQTRKHITEFAAQVLLEDADSLRSKNP